MSDKGSSDNDIVKQVQGSIWWALITQGSRSPEDAERYWVQALNV